MVSFSVLFSLQSYGIVSKQASFTYGKHAKKLQMWTAFNQLIVENHTIFLMEKEGMGTIFRKNTLFVSTMHPLE